MSKVLTVILGNAPIYNGNRGCVALSYTSIYLIDKALTELGLDYKLYLTDSGHPSNGIYHIEFGGKSYEYRQIRHIIPLSLKQFLNYLVKPQELAKANRTFQESDFIFDIGQGDSFSDIYGKDRFNTINLIHREAQKHHKPYCLLPQTIGPFSENTIKKLANKALSQASMVMARDKMSYNYVVRNVPGQKNVKGYLDTAFFLPYKKLEFRSDFVHVGLNISALLWHGGYTRDNQFGLKVDYQKTVRSIINYFLQQQNVELHLIPHVVDSERSIENDYAVSFDLYKEYHSHNLVLAPLFLSPVDAKDYISGMDFFMGARMHSTIAAFSSGVAVVPMSYSRKFNGLFEDTLSYHHIADMRTKDETQMLANIIREFEHKDDLRKEIQLQLLTTVADRKKLLLDQLKIFFHVGK